MLVAVTVALIAGGWTPSAPTWSLLPCLLLLAARRAATRAASWDAPLSLVALAWLIVALDLIDMERRGLSIISCGTSPAGLRGLLIEIVVVEVALPGALTLLSLPRFLAMPYKRSAPATKWLLIGMLIVAADVGLITWFLYVCRGD